MENSIIVEKKSHKGFFQTIFCFYCTINFIGTEQILGTTRKKVEGKYRNKPCLRIRKKENSRKTQLEESFIFFSFFF